MASQQKNQQTTNARQNGPKIPAAVPQIYLRSIPAAWRSLAASISRTAWLTSPVGCRLKAQKSLQIPGEVLEKLSHKNRAKQQLGNVFISVWNSIRLPSFRNNITKLREALTIPFEPGFGRSFNCGLSKGKDSRGILNYLVDSCTVSVSEHSSHLELTLLSTQLLELLA